MIEKCNNAKNPLTARLFGDKQSLIGKKNFHPVFVTQAFTMAETLIVVIVLGIIAMMVIPGLVIKQRESINRSKVRKAMAFYEFVINRIVIENDLKSIEALRNYANSEENCVNSNKYFKISQGEGCTFKTTDGLWWNIQEIDRTIISLKEINENKQGNTLAETIAKANNTENYDAFVLVTTMDNHGAFRINDLAWEKTNDTGMSNVVAKLYDFMIGKNNQQGNNNGNNQTGPLLRTMVGDDGSYERYVYDLLGNKIFRYYNCGNDGYTGCNSQRFDYDGKRITAQYNNCGKEGTGCAYPYYKWVYETDGDNTIETKYSGCSNSSGSTAQACTSWTITTKDADGNRISEQECDTSGCANVKYYANEITYNSTTGNTSKKEYYNYCKADGTGCRSYKEEVKDNHGNTIAEYSKCTKSTGVCTDSKLYVYDYVNNTKTVYESCQGTSDINSCDSSKTVTYQLYYE